MLHTANTASIKLNSNVVTEFPRSKKLIKYPRVALTQNALNNGYAAEASTENNGTSSGQAYRVFDGRANGERGYHSIATMYTSGSTYNGTASITDAHGTQHQGEWIKLQMPTTEKMKLSGFSFSPREGNYYHRAPYKGVFLGSTDGIGTNWHPIHYFDNVAGSELATVSRTFENTTNDYYNHIALVVYEVGPNATYGDVLNFAEMELFGVPEHDPEADGVDVVVKSVPNVPNTDWLEVYWDGQDYTSMPSIVTDKSGNGVTGTPNGGVGFDTEYKAFMFDGVDDYIESTSSAGLSGDAVHSFSGWVYWSSFATSGSIFHVARPDINDQTNTVSAVNAGTDGRLQWYFYNNEVYSTRIISLNTWYHITCVYVGGGGYDYNKHLYINGQRETWSQTGGSGYGGVTAIDADATFAIGYDQSRNHYYHSGKIANARIFNRALTSDEIYQLYAYQKEYFGHGDLSMTLKAGRLGIGTSEPRAALDVRGDVAGRFTRFLTYDHVVHSSTTFNSSPSWPIGQSLSLVSHTWDIPTEYAALGRGTLNGYAYVSWSGSCPNPWQAVLWIDIYYNGVYMGRGSTNSDVGNTSANHGNTTIALTHHDEENTSTLDSANVTTGFRLPNCNLSRGSTIKIDLICQRGDYQSGENVVWTNRNHTAPSSNARDYEQGTTNFFVLLNVE